MHIHFIGIGGIGISALARYYLEKGYKITGSDISSSEITTKLKQKGAQINIGHSRIPNYPDLIVYSAAIDESNPELKEAKEQGIETKSYPEALGEITRDYYTIAVSGTHGKSSVSSLIALILEKAGYDPTVIVGTQIKELGNTNFKKGESNYLVIEADEWDRSFLHYCPNLIVITNIEREHLDCYGDLEDIISAFKKFTLRLPPEGALIYNKDHQNTRKLLDSLEKRSFSAYPYSLKESAQQEKVKENLKLPGKHNLSNALAALTSSKVLGVEESVALKAISEYKGIWRRFETVKEKPVKIISDYGHHPTEIISTIKSAREKYTKSKIWLVFQPHQYQRTYYLYNDFVETFKKIIREKYADKLLLTDIFEVKGRETSKKEISSEKLVKDINKPEAEYIEKDKIKDYLKSNSKEGDIVIIMGAGDIYKITEEL